MWNKKSVSIVFATYREKASIRGVINDFVATGFVDEVIVVNNNAEPGTDEEIRQTKARIVYESKQGYGAAFRRGIKEAVGEYIVLCEPDATFLGSDLERLLAYAKEFPVVFGSRTNRSTIESGSAMSPMRRLGNVIFAKVIEILFGAKTITDIGCTYKLFTREALRKIEPQFKNDDPLFATELILLVVSNHIKFIEIPTSFRERVGMSTIVSHWYKVAKWGVKVWVYIWLFWFRWLVHKKEKPHEN